MTCWADQTDDDIVERTDNRISANIFDPAQRRALARRPGSEVAVTLIRESILRHGLYVEDIFWMERRMDGWN